MPETILVLDDEELIRDVLAKILANEGHEVVTAESGERGLEILAENPARFSVMITDLRMKRMSGLDVLEATTSKTHPAIRRRILLSGSLDEHTLEEATRLEAITLAKPCQAAVILMVVKA